MTQKQFVSTGVVGMSVVMIVAPMLWLVRDVFRILHTLYFIEPSSYDRYYRVGWSLVDVLYALILLVIGLILMNKRVRVTEWLLRKMNSVEDAEPPPSN